MSEFSPFMPRGPELFPNTAVYSEQQESIASMAARVMRMEGENAGQVQRDSDARLARERAIGEQMMRDFKALAARRGVVVPEKIGGQGGWLHRLGHSKAVAERGLARDWAEYKDGTQWGERRFGILFQHGHDIAKAEAALARRRAIGTQEARRDRARHTILSEALEVVTKAPTLAEARRILQEELDGLK